MSQESSRSHLNDAGKGQVRSWRRKVPASRRQFREVAVSDMVGPWRPWWEFEYLSTWEAN